MTKHKPLVAQFLSQNYARVRVSYCLELLGVLTPFIVLPEIQYTFGVAELCYQTAVNQASRRDSSGQGELQHNARLRGLSGSLEVDDEFTA